MMTRSLKKDRKVNLRKRASNRENNKKKTITTKLKNGKIHKINNKLIKIVNFLHLLHSLPLILTLIYNNRMN